MAPRATPLEKLHKQAQRRKPTEDLLFQLQAASVGCPELELRFSSERRWRFDLAWRRFTGERPNHLAIEIDGGGFVQGRHSRGLGIEKDCEKYAHAMLAGWRVLRVTPKQITSGEALDWIQKLLAQ